MKSIKLISEEIFLNENQMVHLNKFLKDVKTRLWKFDGQSIITDVRGGDNSIQKLLKKDYKKEKSYDKDAIVLSNEKNKILFNFNFEDDRCRISYY